MKIAVIGNGIIGSLSSIYLSRKGYEVDCIGPAIKTAQEKIHFKEDQIPTNYNNGFVSPKFKRKDLIKNKFISDLYFPKESQNFFALEIANEFGLAKFWGGNLAFNALNVYIKKLNLSEKEFDFICKNIPMLDIQDYYRRKFPEIKNKLDHNNYQKDSEINSSILSIYEKKCDINNLPCHNFSTAIFGTTPLDLSKCNRINGVAKSIDFNKKGKNSLTKIYIDNSRKLFFKEYNYVLIACGAIGSYRLVMNSIKNKKLFKMYNRIKHHPMISTLTFIPNIPYPEKHIGMSNLDLKIKIDNEEIFINFHPFESFLKTKYKFYTNFQKQILGKLTYKLMNKFSFIPLTPLWILRRIYIAAIYLPSDLTSSYIGYEVNKIKIIGGLRSDFEKYVMRKIWRKICSKLRTKYIFNLFLKPIRTEIGADYHYASSLVDYTDEDGLLKFNKNTNVIVIDSSSSDILPTPNPTLYFLSRAIKLLRKI